MNREELENKYKIRFKDENEKFRPVNEWLDDIYLLLNDKELCGLIVDIDENANELFKDLIEPRERF